MPRADLPGRWRRIARITCGPVVLLYAGPEALAVCGPIPGAGALGAAALSAALSVLFARRTLGGRTGDTLGATIAVTEVIVCATLLALWHG